MDLKAVEGVEGLLDLTGGRGRQHLMADQHVSRCCLSGLGQCGPGALGRLQLASPVLLEEVDGSPEVVSAWGLQIGEPVLGQSGAIGG